MNTRKHSSINKGKNARMILGLNASQLSRKHFLCLRVLELGTKLIFTRTQCIDFFPFVSVENMSFVVLEFTPKREESYRNVSQRLVKCSQMASHISLASQTLSVYKTLLITSMVSSQNDSFRDSNQHLVLW